MRKGANLPRRLRISARLPLVGAAAFSAASTTSWAMQPGPMPGAPPPTAPRKEKKKGPAEAAPKDRAALTPIEPVPAHPSRFRRLQLLELHGYTRMRADYFHKLDLGLGNSLPTEVSTDNKFFRPPAETDEFDGNTTRSNDARCLVRLQDQGVNAERAARRCARRSGMASANMRLRVQPTLHVTDMVKIHATLDLLDNLVLGSTPDSLAWDNPFAPIDLFTRTQTPPTAGLNSFRDSIVVKRAYGQIRFGWGLDLKFGRMPWHWGMGLVANDGNGHDRNEVGDIVRMLDMDYGDSVDSLSATLELGKDRRRSHALGFSWDWAASGPTTAQLLGPEWDSGGRVGQDFSAEKYDNVQQWSFSVLRRDDPSMLKRKLSLGTPVLNYGAMVWLRYQDVDRAIGSPGLGDGLGTNPTYRSDVGDDADPLGQDGVPLGNGDLDDSQRSGLQNYANLLVHRRALVATPDLWLRVSWRSLRVELEAAGVFGRFRHRDLTDIPGEGFDLQDASTQCGAQCRTDLVQVGYALEFKYGMFSDRFHVGLDQGFATGDESAARGQNPQDPLLLQNGALGVDTGDNDFRNFRFNPAYMQDLLLFRELLGTVANAAYFKPWAAFYFFEQNFSGRLDIEYAFAHKRQSTYGNRLNWGLELDLALRYHDKEEPIFVQLQYGVVFPFGAFDRRPELYDAAAGSTLDNATPGNGGDAKAAQTVQGQIGIRF